MIVHFRHESLLNSTCKKIIFIYMYFSILGTYVNFSIHTYTYIKWAGHIVSQFSYVISTYDCCIVNLHTCPTYTFNTEFVLQLKTLQKFRSKLWIMRSEYNRVCSHWHTHTAALTHRIYTFSVDGHTHSPPWNRYSNVYDELALSCSSSQLPGAEAFRCCSFRENTSVKWVKPKRT